MRRDNIVILVLNIKCCNTRDAIDSTLPMTQLQAGMPFLFTWKFL